MNIFKFRVIIDTEEDVFRDIEIETTASFEEFHRAILKAFDWNEGEMASFYLSNESWDRGVEIPLMDMGLTGGSGNSMDGLKLSDLVQKPDEKLIYVYDFLRMWCFYIELQTVKKAAPAILYPHLSLAFGDTPDQESKEVDLFEGLDMPKKEKRESTGDPELDAYLSETDDQDDDEFDDGMESLDDLDERY